MARSREKWTGRRRITTKTTAATAPPPLPSYPVDDRWRVVARFDAFEPPQRMRVPDVRGGSMELKAVGQLVFRLGGEERRLTAVGYRVVKPQAVEDGGWTVVDFNFASNPPCAFSTFTTCPLSPPENRLPVAVEAGLKQLPSVRGYRTAPLRREFASPSREVRFTAPPRAMRAQLRDCRTP